MLCEYGDSVSSNIKTKGQKQMRAKIQNLPDHGRYMGLPGPLIPTGETWETLPSNGNKGIAKQVCSVGGPICGKWSGEALVKIGDRVKVTFNGLGTGTIVSFFTDFGGPMGEQAIPFIGVEVKADKQPDWHIKQNGLGYNYHVYGAEIKLLAVG